MSLDGRVGISAGIAYLFGTLAKATGFGYAAGVAIEGLINAAIATALAVAYINVCIKIAEGKINDKSTSDIIEIIKEEFQKQRQKQRNKEYTAPEGL